MTTTELQTRAASRSPSSSASRAPDASFTQGAASGRPHPAKQGPLNVHSTVVRSEKPNKGLEVQLSSNPNIMHRLVGYLPDGTKALIALRQGKGGMDINKIAGGKVYAVAADALSPTLEKDAEGKPARVQKQEDGMPLYSSSGFYLLSSKDYPALDILTAYSRLLEDGDKVVLSTQEQLDASVLLELEGELDLDLLQSCMLDLLSDEVNLVGRFNDAINTRRKRGIERAVQEAEDEGETPQTVEFAPLPISTKDGQPCVMLSYRLGAQTPLHTVTVMREAWLVNEDYDDGRMVLRHFDAEQAFEFFMNSQDGRDIRSALEQGQPLKVCLTGGHLMRTSVSFRRKVSNVLEAPPEKAAFGDGVYIKAALQGWVRAICPLMYSQHPRFPAADYDSNHYVAAPRQFEVVMTRLDDKRWAPPQAQVHSFGSLQGKALKKPAGG